MGKYLVRYTQVEETTYEQWVEAGSVEEALNKIKNNETYEEVVDTQGIKVKDYEVVEKE